MALWQAFRIAVSCIELHAAQQVVVGAVDNVRWLRDSFASATSCSTALFLVDGLKMILLLRSCLKHDHTIADLPR